MDGASHPAIIMLTSISKRNFRADVGSAHLKHIHIYLTAWKKSALKHSQTFSGASIEFMDMLLDGPSSLTTVTTAGQEWTNGLNSSFALKLDFTRNLEFMAF
jgi:hypothetical protein